MLRMRRFRGGQLFQRWFPLEVRLAALAATLPFHKWLQLSFDYPLLNSNNITFSKDDS
jgi:hypothetical protein